MEHWDELWPGGFRFRFDDNVFKPSTDTFLLGDFAEVRRGERVCDLGAGIGLLGLLLLARQQELHITNIDIDSAACALAEENAAVNGLEDRVAVLRADLRDRTALPKAGSFDLCVANPPYFPPHTGRVAEGSRGTARSETACAFDQLWAAAAYLLLPGPPGGTDGGADGRPAPPPAGAEGAALRAEGRTDAAAAGAAVLPPSRRGRTGGAHAAAATSRRRRKWRAAPHLFQG